MNETPRTDAEIADDIENLRDHVQETSCYWSLAGHARQLERELAEAREQLNEWTTLCIWGGTPQHVHDFIKGQQERIHAAQDAEQQRDRLAEAIKWALEVGQVVGGSKVALSEAIAAVKGGTP